MANKPKKGDVGTIIELDMQENIAAATEHSEETGNGIVFIVTKSSGAVTKWLNCAVYQTDFFRYTCVTDDLDEASADSSDVPYKITPKFALGSWEGHGDTVEMYVYDTEETPG